MERIRIRDAAEFLKEPDWPEIRKELSELWPRNAALEYWGLGIIAPSTVSTGSGVITATAVIVVPALCAEDETYDFGATPELGSEQRDIVLHPAEVHPLRLRPMRRGVTRCVVVNRSMQIAKSGYISTARMADL